MVVLTKYVKPGNMITLTVNYNTDDLDVCSWDLDRLILAQYDEDTGE